MIGFVASTVSTIGVKIVLKAAIPFSTIGVKIVLKIDASSATGSSATGSCLLTRLVSRSGAGGGDIRTDITATATHTATTMVMVTHTDTGMAMDPRLRSCSAGSLGRATTMVLLMESWDRQRDARCARTNATTISA